MQQQFKEFLIRDWEPRDRQVAAQLIDQVLAEYGLCGEPCGADRDVLDVEAHYTQGAFWVVEKDGAVVGTAGFYPIPRGTKAVEIRKMYLVPGVRGQGLGRYLMAELEQEIAQRSFQEIYLETATALKEAVSLYESLGYEQLDASEVETDRCDRIYRKVIGQG